MQTSHAKLRALTEGAILIALAEILSFLPLYKMPWGGSVDLAMLPSSFSVSAGALARA